MSILETDSLVLRHLAQQDAACNDQRAIASLVLLYVQRRRALRSVIVMMDTETVRSLVLAKPGAEETFPFDPVTLVAKVGGKLFALLALTEAPPRLTLKCDPHHSAALRAAHAAIQPGYHMNKQHWITLTLDESLPPELVEALIDASYQLVVQRLPRATRASLQP